VRLASLLALLRSALGVAVLVAAPARAQWTQLGGPLPANVFGLAAGDGVLVLGSAEADAGDVFRSTDGGQTWANARLPNGGALFCFAHGDALFVGTYLSGLHRSTDGGQTWAEVAVTGSSFSTMASAGDALLLGQGLIGGGPIQRSTDGGLTWAPSSPVADTRALLPVGDAVLAATADDGVYRSADGGQTWALANAGLPADAQAQALALHGGAVFAGVRSPSAPALRVYRSDDGGASWAPSGGALPVTANLEFAALASWQGALYAGLGAFTGGAVYRSTDDGATWAPHADGLPAGAAGQVMTGVGDALWLGTDHGPFRKATPDGPWSYAGQGTTAITGVAALLVDGADLFVGLTNNGGGGRGLWRTADRGATWTRVAGGLEAGAAIRALLRHGSTLFAGDYGSFPRGLHRSEDGGTTWTFSSDGISPSTIIHVLHAHGGALLVGAHEALYRSTDGGFTWDDDLAMNDTRALATFEGALYAGRGAGGVDRSTDGGLTWAPFSDGLSPDDGVEVLVVSRGRLYAATWGAGVYRLDGSTWQPLGVGMFVGALVDVGGVLVAASALDGAFYSADEGATWAPFDEGYTGGEIYELAADAEALLIGSRGHGLWSRPLADLPVPTASPGALPAASGLAVRPNPARDRAVLHLAPRAAGRVDVEVLDALGRRVRTVTADLPAGPSALPLDVRGLAPGAYLVRVRGAGGAQQVRLTVVR
jgi:photosystem II stability/assembly factor-like uncharacterized protein